MKIYGKLNRDSETPVSLEEVTLVVTKAELSELFSYISNCIDEAKSNPDWEHFHLRDFLRLEDSAMTDLVVFSAEKMG
jgi:hypothetical protein